MPPLDAAPLGTPAEAAPDQSSTRMPLRSPKPSIREMKKAIIDAGLETEDLVERSHVEERYEEALALQPREVLGLQASVYDGLFHLADARFR